MSSYAHSAPAQQRLGFGFAGAVLLHIGVAVALIAAAFLRPARHKSWGENSASAGAIQASMISALPLPPKAPPVEHQVLAEEHTSPTPAPPVKEKTEPPPRKDDVLVKNKVDPKIPVKTAPKPTPDPPKHPQPTPETPKANSGASATQIASAVSQSVNGTATVSTQSRSFGARYAYYLRVIGATVTRNYNEQHPDPRSSQDKSVTFVFDIQQDGSPTNLRIETPSGSASLDAAGKRAIALVDNFGPLPEGDHITIEYKFDYHHP